MFLVSVGAGVQVQVFSGNQTVPDHFHELYVEQDYLIVGARYSSFIH
jgi:hypothetical protein